MKKLRQADTRCLEAFLACVMLAWVAVMVLPSWSASSSYVHRVMVSLMPQWWWNTAFAVIGVTKLYGVLSDNLSMRRTCAFWSACLFAYVSIALWMGPALQPVSLILPVYAVASVLSYLRIGELIRYEAKRGDFMASYQSQGRSTGHGVFRR